LLYRTKVPDLFRELISEWEAFESIAPPDYQPILESEDSAFIQSINLNNLIIKEERKDDNNSSIIVLAYRLSPHSEIEINVDSDRILSISCLHTWVPGVTSKISHCRSVGCPLPFLFEQI